MSEQIEIKSVDDLYNFIRESNLSIEKYLEIIQAYTDTLTLCDLETPKDEFLDMLEGSRHLIEKYGYFPLLLDVLWDSEKRKYVNFNDE